jgi:hypothetical protein
MSIIKINFNQEHKTKLDTLLLKHLYNNTQFTGGVGTKINMHQLLHETSLNSLQSLYQTLTKSLDTLKNLDQWSMNDYQQEKQENLRELIELVNLLIGFKRYESTKESNRKKASEIRDELKKLKEQNKTPEERIKELEEQAKIYEVEI